MRIAVACPFCDNADVISDAEKIRALPWSIASNVLTSSIFCTWTFFGSIFLLFLKELGISKGQIGLLLSVFPFCGLIAPFVAPALARIGAKRVSLATFAGRNLVTALLLLLPFVIVIWRQSGAMLYLAGVVLVFAVFRALLETAMYPWAQEYVPNSVRGKYAAINTVASTLASVAALAIAGYVVSHGSGLGHFLWLQAAGCLAGLIGTVLLMRVPGGLPVPHTQDRRELGTKYLEALRDGNFRYFLFGTTGLVIGAGMLSAFMPLLLVEKVGIQPGTVIWLDNASMIGGVSASLMWGWMADRFGSRTALMPGLTLSLAVSVVWCVILATGHSTALHVPILAVLGFISGMAVSAIAIGSSRLLLTGVVPPEKNVVYTAVYYAWSGLASGMAPLLAGGILSWVTPLHGNTALTDAYTVLFLLSLLPAILGWVFFYRTRPDGSLRTRDVLKNLVFSHR